MTVQPRPDLGVAVMQRPGNGIFAASPTGILHTGPHSPALRPPLPDRNVTSTTIEDAYVSFILYCNPAVPLDADTSALREAFRTPPKSGGKSFSTFTLFELIKQLEAKELKTWAELALRLGVEPPDQDKGQSSQKIQQYAVRLKRWMHSMHVDTFFKYLMNSPHPYWTEIPSDLDPFTENGRDGVAAEDDMALRALLPHIRPRRGRRRPEDDDLSKSPSQKPRLESPAMPDEFHRSDGYEPWSAHPDGRNAFMFQNPDGSMLNPRPGPPPGPPWGNHDVAQTPLTAYPQSAITPSTRNVFWGEEPRSAITPMKPKSLSKRHGAKVVSSAWKSGGPGGSGKTRGRPPISRQANDGSFSAFPTSESPGFKLPPPGTNGMHMGPDLPLATIPPPTSSSPAVAPMNMNLQPPNHVPASSRPAKPNRLSLQVPERVGGEVRLATPPPILMVNGQETVTNGAVDLGGEGGHNEGNNATDAEVSSSNAGANQSVANPITATDSNASDPPPQDKVQFLDESDTTNLDGLQAYFVHEIVRADWFDAQGNAVPGCTVDEAYAISNTVIERVRAKAPSKEGFLIDMAVLAGGKILMTTTKLRCTRLQELEDRTIYSCEWELRLRDVRGSYKMQETVMHNTWKKPEKDDRSTTVGAETPMPEDPQPAELWQQKYRNLLDIVSKKDRTLAEITYAGLESLRDHARRKDAM